ncbi:hypothetical protein B0H11DRAFT_1907519 [Mycena galericulata]|nr:hypothetical protein B0H11DRAFT_1907519 [Mycena galericulata]
MKVRGELLLSDRSVTAFQPKLNFSINGDVFADKENKIGRYIALYTPHVATTNGESEVCKGGETGLGATVVEVEDWWPLRNVKHRGGNDLMRGTVPLVINRAPIEQSIPIPLGVNQGSETRSTRSAGSVKASRSSICESFGPVSPESRTKDSKCLRMGTVPDVPSPSSIAALK